MTTECLEPTCLAHVTTGTKPDQIRVEPRLYPGSVLRGRQGASVGNDGRVDYSTCGVDVFLAQDADDESVAPTVVAAPLNPDGTPAPSSLKRVLASDGTVRLYAEPSINTVDLIDTVDLTGWKQAATGTLGTVLPLGGSVALTTKAGAFNRLVRPELTVTDFQINPMIFDILDNGGTLLRQVPVLPNILYQITITRAVEDPQGQTISSEVITSIVGANGSTNLGAQILAPDHELRYSVSSAMFYSFDVDEFFPYNAGFMSLRFQLFDLAGADPQ